MVIADNKQLQTAESLMNPASVQVVKLMYNQNLFRDFVPHNKLLADITHTVLEGKVFAKAFHALFFSIAGDSNYATRQTR